MTSDVTPYLSAYLVLVALMAGSFINLAADRVPRGESVIKPRSHCRACGRQLNAIDLLPVIGYALRGGRCATCKAPIGLAAPLVEAVSGALMLAVLVWLGLWPGALVGLGLIGLLGVLVTALGFRISRPAQAAPEV